MNELRFLNISSEKENILNKKLWRYYSVPKFINLINSKKLRFSTPLIFEDPIDGISKKSYLRALKLKNMYKRTLEIFSKSEWKDNLLDNSTIKTENKFNIVNLKKCDTDIAEMLNKLEDDQNIRNHVNNLKNIYVNCWHMNQNESLAMWDLYVGRNTPGVAIKTNVRKLINEITLDYNEKGFYNKVIYRNENKNIKKTLQEIFIKRHCFEYENEFRIAIEKDTDNNYGDGIYKKVDLNNLIDEIYVTPRIEKWEQDTILDLIKKYRKCDDDLSDYIPIKKSNLMQYDKKIFTDKNNPIENIIGDPITINKITND